MTFYKQKMLLKPWDYSSTNTKYFASFKLIYLLSEHILWKINTNKFWSQFTTDIVTLHALDFLLITITNIGKWDMLDSRADQE